MSEFETEEMREAARSKLSGLLLRLVQAPHMADQVVAETQDIADFADQFVELKIAQLTDGILASVRSEVARILEEHLRAHPTVVNNDAGTTERTTERLYELAEHLTQNRARLEQLMDADLLNEFTTRVVNNAWTGAELERLHYLIEWTRKNE